jgi:hypothetical protein
MRLNESSFRATSSPANRLLAMEIISDRDSVILRSGYKRFAPRQNCYLNRNISMLIRKKG